MKISAKIFCTWKMSSSRNIIPIKSELIYYLLYSVSGSQKFGVCLALFIDVVIFLGHSWKNKSDEIKRLWFEFQNDDAITRLWNRVLYYYFYTLSSHVLRVTCKYTWLFRQQSMTLRTAAKNRKRKKIRTQFRTKAETHRRRQVSTANSADTLQCISARCAYQFIRSKGDKKRRNSRWNLLKEPLVLPLFPSIGAMGFEARTLGNLLLGSAKLRSRSRSHLQSITFDPCKYTPFSNKYISKQDGCCYIIAC